jgi:hypothetical protein
MSIYRKIDREPSSDVHAKTVKRDAAIETSTPGSQHKGAPTDEPLPQTVAWAAKLPPDVQPLVLMRSFPRIANFVAANWSEPTSFRAYVDELFVDRRGDRRGFPPEVMEELFALRAFYEDLYPTTDKKWNDANKHR